MQYELPTSDTYISYGHWDNLKKGLLAGESLMLELRRMEKAHLEQDSRFQDIEKTISMAEDMPGTLLAAADAGRRLSSSCGKGCLTRISRATIAGMIKSLSISIKTGANVPQEVHATLTQLGSKILLEPDPTPWDISWATGGAEQPDHGRHPLQLAGQPSHRHLQAG